ncbi:MAG TPA: hypothetical protein DDY70_06390 [Clostridiales bacterium]|nr:hypothetical protein [Clostridiales bacterium]
MKRKIFTRVFLLTFLCVLLVFAAGVIAVAGSGRTVVEERLRAECGLLSSLLRTEEDIDGLTGYQNRDSFRITVISEAGEVLYESSVAGEMENHADREEIRAALAGSPRFVERYSATFGCRMTYCAVENTLEDGTKTVIRVAVKSSELSGFLGVAIPSLACALVLALLISLLLAGRLSTKISEKVRGVADSLRSLNEGEYHPLVTDSREPEFYAVFREINDLNGKTRALIEERTKEGEKLSFVLENVSEGILALDADGHVAIANGAALNLLDGEQEDIGKPLLYLIEDTALCEKILAPGGGQFESHVGERDLAVTVRRIADSPLASEISRIVILNDITAAKAVAKEKSDFFANASHELKTPITVTQGISELILAKDTVDEGTKKQVERIHKEALRMAGLISDMLRLSDLERQKGTPERVPVELRGVVDEVTAELHARMEERHLTLRVSGRGRVMASPDKMYELVTNLCSNAVNYNKEGGSIDISITDGGGHVTLTVKDTGIGIPEDQLPRIFERFYRVDPSRSKKTGGTGLGLAIVKHICAMYGATVSVESQPDVGTAFRIIF